MRCQWCQGLARRSYKKLDGTGTTVYRAYAIDPETLLALCLHFTDRDHLHCHQLFAVVITAHADRVEDASPQLLVAGVLWRALGRSP